MMRRFIAISLLIGIAPGCSSDSDPGGRAAGVGGAVVWVSGPLPWVGHPPAASRSVESFSDAERAAHPSFEPTDPFLIRLGVAGERVGFDTLALASDGQAYLVFFTPVRSADGTVTFEPRKLSFTVAPTVIDRVRSLVMDPAFAALAKRYSADVPDPAAAYVTMGDGTHTRSSFFSGAYPAPFRALAEYCAAEVLRPARARMEFAEPVPVQRVLDEWSAAFPGS